MNWKLFRYAAKSRDMRKRIFVVLGMILIFRFMAHIPIPLSDSSTLKQLLENLFSSSGLLGFLNFLSGGAMASFSIMLLGLGPYINASIVVQMLSKAVPKLKAMSQEGEDGRRKMTQYTRMLTVPFAIMQSIGMLFLVRQQAGSITGLSGLSDSTTLFQWGVMVAALVGASMLLMWLGELISEQGVGNGISLIITVGILSQLPAMIGTIVSIIGSDVGAITLPGGLELPISLPGLLLSLLLILLALGSAYFVIKINEAQRAVKISYAKRVSGNRAYGGVDSVIPIKLISAGVIPIVFAVAFLAVPAFIGQILTSMDSAGMQQIGTNLINWFSNGNGLATDTAGALDLQSIIYPAAYFLLVVMFTYFYTAIVFDPKELAESLQKRGGFIPGIRPGVQTEEYLARIVTRLTLFGSLALGFLAVLPFLTDFLVIASFGTPISQQLTIGGTGVLILVSVALETLRQIESKALMVSYDSDTNITS